MDKEMLEKVNELLKANGRQELSADEAEKIVGGEFTLHDDGTCTLDDNTMTCDQFTSLMYAMTKAYGIKAAISWLHKKTEFWCTEMGKNAMGSDAERMEKIMKRFWKDHHVGNMG